MKRYAALAVISALILSALSIGTTNAGSPYDIQLAMQRMAQPPAPPPIVAAEIQERVDSPIAVAEVFGRSEGCANASPAMVGEVADAARTSGVPPRILAGLVAVESSCNPQAISSKGAIGLTQVNVKVWAKKYDLSGRYNLLNEKDNLAVGSHILADYTRAYGVQEGLRRYNGLGVGCDTCDAGYTGKILVLAEGRKQ